MEIRDEILEDMGDMEELIANTQDGDGDSAYSSHMADAGTDAQEREKAYMLLARENKFLGFVISALRRVETEQYGICVSCGEEIEDGRLEAVPHTQHCFSCKSIVSH